MGKWYNFYFVLDRKLVRRRPDRAFSFSDMRLKHPRRNRCQTIFLNFRPSAIYKAMRTIILNILFELKLRDYSLQISVKNQRCVQIEAFKICGVSKAEKRCLQLIKRVAIIVLLGLSETIAFAKIINLVKSFLKEMAMMWSLFNSVTFPTAMALLVMNKVPVAPLNPGSVHSEVLYSFFSQSIDKAKVKYQYIQNN